MTQNIPSVPLLHRLLHPAIFCGLAIAINPQVQAASIDSDWNQFSSGTYLWNDATNWTSQTWAGSSWGSPVTPGTAPNNGTDAFAARIINASTGNILVETSSAVTVGRLWLERSSTGSTTLKLGGNLTVTGSLSGPPATGSNSRPTGFNNTVANTPSSLALDLNSNTFDASGAAAASLQNARNYTIRDTSVPGNGSFIVQNITRDSAFIAGSVSVENNVTVKLTTYAATDFRNSIGSSSDPGWLFSAGSTLWLSANGSGSAVAFNNSAGNQFGNIVVGSIGNATAANYGLTNHINVQGDLTYHGGSLLSMSAGPRKIFIQGNFTDTSTTGADYSGRGDTGGVVFNGGSNKEQEVLIAREGLTSVFQIGESAAIHANVTLKHDLTTTQGGTLPGNNFTGRVVVWDESRLNVDSFTLQATTVDIRSDSLLAFTFGIGSDALIKSTGVMTLNSFVLQLTYNEQGWNDGDDLLLFQYGTLAGTPNLKDITLDGFAYGGLYNDGNGNIWLTDVSAIPEPGTIILMLGGIAAIIVPHLRRRNFPQKLS